ncbi:MAG TPA: UvrB/UvrC motif-containing protein, partial [Thermoanaerobaculia bacterium]|nr:UvrB/UvrC motif-containing protein [Thermoanaerobaculia bacterium]
MERLVAFLHAFEDLQRLFLARRIDGDRLEAEIRTIVKEMKKAISDKDFEKAVFLREREIELKEEIERIKQERESIGEEMMEVTKKDV